MTEIHTLDHAHILMHEFQPFTPKWLCFGWGRFFSLTHFKLNVFSCEPQQTVRDMTFLLLLVFFHLTHDLNSLDNSQRYHHTLVLTINPRPAKVYKCWFWTLFSMATFPQAKQCTKLKLYGYLNVTRWPLSEKQGSEEGTRLPWGGKKPCLPLSWMSPTATYMMTQELWART